MAILISLAIACMLLIFVIALYNYILDNIFIKQFQESKIAKEKVELRLTQSLRSICELLNIPLTYHEQLGDAAGKIVYHHNSLDRLILDHAYIEIINECKERPYVLAHEIGHYMAIKQRNDVTEEGADKEALVLCKSILTQEEQDILDISLNVYFNSNAV